MIKIYIFDREITSSNHSHKKKIQLDRMKIHNINLIQIKYSMVDGRDVCFICRVGTRLEQGGDSPFRRRMREKVRKKEFYGDEERSRLWRWGGEGFPVPTRGHL